MRDEPNVFHAILVPNTLQPYILYESHKAQGHNGSTRLYDFIRKHYYWKKLHQHSNKYIWSCPDCQQIALKEPHYINLHLPVPQFTMSFISMDLLSPYHEAKKGNQYALTVICILTNYVFMIPIRSKNTEEVIIAYLTCVYTTFRGSKYILSDRGYEFTSIQFT